MMSMRQPARHDPLEAVVQAALCPDDGIDYRPLEMEAPALVPPRFPPPANGRTGTGPAHISCSRPRGVQ
jgi:hypothetical protein